MNHETAGHRNHGVSPNLSQFDGQNHLEARTTYEFMWFIRPNFDDISDSNSKWATTWALTTIVGISWYPRKEVFGREGFGRERTKDFGET